MAALTSILVPTRNRPLLARLAVETALKNADEDCEIVIADNSDEPLDLPRGDGRLRHLRPLERVLSMPDNWERALAAARGEWVLLLADKYMLMPDGLAALRSLCSSSDVVSYGCAVLRQAIEPQELGDGLALRTRGGELALPRQVGVTGVRNARDDLEALVQSAAYPVRYPMLYTSIARRSVCEAARRASGRFFLGSCPDVASALQLLASSEKWLQTSVPVVLVQYPGAPQAWSTGASTLAGGALSAAFFRELASSVPAIERTVSGAVFATMLAFARARPDLSLGLDQAWQSFARRTSWEIDGMAPWQRLLWQARLLAYLQRGAFRPRAALAQARASLAGTLPRGWRAGRLKSDAAEVVERRRCGTRDEAIAAVAAAVESARAAAAPISPGLPAGGAM